MNEVTSREQRAQARFWEKILMGDQQMQREPRKEGEQEQALKQEEKEKSFILEARKIF